MRTRSHPITQPLRVVGHIPAAYAIALEPPNEGLAAFRLRHFAHLEGLFLELGHCAAQSPEGRACSREAGHADTTHWAESPIWNIVELWLGGEIVAELAS